MFFFIFIIFFHFQNLHPEPERTIPNTRVHARTPFASFKQCVLFYCIFQKKKHKWEREEKIIKNKAKQMASMG